MFVSYIFTKTTTLDCFAKYLSFEKHFFKIRYYTNDERKFPKTTITTFLEFSLILYLPQGFSDSND